MLKKILFFKLKLLAKATIHKYQPKIVAITGSVGKTSTKGAIFCVLSQKFSVRSGLKNYNNEIGLPLTVFGANTAAGKNIFKWLGIFYNAIKNLLITDKDYPQILILEMGADRPGNIDYLVNIAKPDIAVVTTIGQSHIEFFGSQDKIAQEKFQILKKLDSDDWAILNYDDELVRSMTSKSKSRVYTFGQNEKSDIRIHQIRLSRKDNVYGTSFKLKFQGAEAPMFLPNVLGWQQAQATAAAAAVGLAMGLNLVEIGQALAGYKPAPGRTNLIGGVKNTWVIDDTYNASPQSSLVALDILADFPDAQRRIAVFGDMLELGNLTELGHRQVGEAVYKKGIDYLFVIGEKSRDIARGAKEAGMSDDKIFHFARTIEAGIFLQERLKTGDVILVKGSRGSKMEQVVYEIMARPWESDELLVGPISR